MKAKKLNLAKETLIQLQDQQAEMMVGGKLIVKWVGPGLGYPDSARSCVDGSIYWNCTLVY